MRAAIYIEQGVVQVALTPEDEWERNALRLIEKADKVSTFRGEFYQCQGGWYRHGGQGAENSLMFLIEKAKVEAEEAGNGGTRR
jgi:hypothetical protein